MTMLEKKRSVVVWSVGAVALVWYRWTTGRRRKTAKRTDTDAAVKKTRAPEQKKKLRLYYYRRSPCARRVWQTLRVKKIDFEAVEVDLLKGEQRSAEFLALNPQGKVPVLTYREEEGAPLEVLYESAAIVAWLEEKYPEPKLFDDALQVEQWMAWELALAEAQWPLSREQVDGVIWRFRYSPSSFRAPDAPGGKPGVYYAARARKIYTHTFLTPGDRRHRYRKCLRAACTAEQALSTPSSRYLVGRTITQADLWVYARLIKLPQNGIDLAQFPRLSEYLSRLSRELGDFSKTDALVASGSSAFLAADLGLSPTFVKWCLPWPILVLLGNVRSGVAFTRVSWDLALPRTAAIFEKEEEEEQTLLHQEPPVLWYDASNLMCCAVVGVLGTDEEWTPRPVDSARLEHELSSELKTVSPFGELPALEMTGDTKYFGASVVLKALSRDLSPLDRVWLGFARTTWYYLVEPLKRQLVDVPTLLATYGSSQEVTKRCLDLYGEDDKESSKDACAEFQRCCELVDDQDAIAYARGLAIELWTDKMDAIERGAAALIQNWSNVAVSSVVSVVAVACVYARRFGLVGGGDDWLDTAKKRLPGLRGLLEEYGRKKTLRSAVGDLVLLHSTDSRPPPCVGHHGLRYSTVRGVVHPPFFREDVVEHLRSHFEPEASDVHVVTYPKCGTTWAQQIVLLLLNNGDPTKVPPHPALQKEAPWLEACYCRTPRFGGPCPYYDAQTLARTWPRHAGRRVFKSHAPADLFVGGGEDSSSKIVYVARHAKDVCCSLYRHCRALPPYEYSEGTVDDFVELFTAGLVEHGSWRDHHLGWFKASQSAPHRILYIHYEDMKLHPAQAVKKIAAHLGILSSSSSTSYDALIDAVVRHSSFDSMKKATLSNLHHLLAKDTSSSAQATSRFSLGKVGAWHVDKGGLLTDFHSSRIDRTLLRAPLPPGLLFLQDHDDDQEASSS